MKYFFHRIHRNHRISYKSSPHSPHFLQKLTQKPRPGLDDEINEDVQAHFNNNQSKANFLFSIFPLGFAVLQCPSPCFADMTE